MRKVSTPVRTIHLHKLQHCHLETGCLNTSRNTTTKLCIQTANVFKMQHSVFLCVVVQVLCCVDKQGVLSWPNPSPETVLFFSGRVEPPHNSQDDLRDDLSVNSYCRMEADDDRDEVCACMSICACEGML